MATESSRTVVEILDRGISKLRKDVRKGASVRGLGKPQSKADMKHTFIPLCKAVLDCLRCFGEDKDGLLAETKRQLDERKLVVSCFGLHNSGKSTLLNTIIGDELLPVSIQNQTAVLVELKHDDKVHKGACPDNPHPTVAPDGNSLCKRCPILVTSYNREEGVFSSEYKGSRLLRAQLSHANCTMRKILKIKEQNQELKGTEELPDTFTVMVNLPLMSEVPSPWVGVMVDNPGFGDANAAVNHLAKTAMQTTAVYVYVLDYQRLEGDVDAQSFKLMLEKDRDIFNKEPEFCRLLIAVTKYDSFYSYTPFEEGKLSATKVKETVCQSIKEATGIRSFPQENVVPVCSQWASIARQLPYQPESDPRNLLEHAKVALRSYDGECAVGQDVRAPDYDKWSPEDIAAKLEDVSAVPHLEDKLKRMIGNCRHIWVRNIESDCSRYLKVAMKSLQQSMQQLEESIYAQSDVLDKFEDLHSRIIKQITEIHAENSSVVYGHFEAEYNKDTEEVCSVESITKVTDWERFEERCKLKQRHPDGYHKRELLRDVEDHLRISSQQLQDKLLAVEFWSMHNYQLHKSKELIRLVEALKNSAMKFKSGSIVLGQADDTLEECEGASRATEPAKPVTDIVRQNPPRLEDLSGELAIENQILSLWSFILRAFKELLGMNTDQIDLRAYFKAAELIKALGGFKEIVFHECEKYIRCELKKKVSELFFKRYGTDVNDCTKMFEQKFDDIMQSGLAKIKEMQEAISRADQEMGREQEWMNHLTMLERLLHSKAREFRTQQFLEDERQCEADSEVTSSLQRAVSELASLFGD